MSKKLSNDQIKAIIDTMVIVVDTREKANTHITDAFDKWKKSIQPERMHFNGRI